MFSHATYVIVPALITLSGVWLRWRLTALEMEAEEQLKEGKLTARQMENRMRWAREGGRLLTLTGIGLLGLSLLMITK